jgi:hypothetical protein
MRPTYQLSERQVRGVETNLERLAADAIRPISRKIFRSFTPT